MRNFIKVILRWVELLLGLFILSLGIAFSITSDLGATPAAALPAVTNLLTGLSVGTMTTLISAVFVVLQILLLRREYRWVQLLQLPLVALFGVMIDVASAFLVQIGVTYSAYWQQWILVIVGIVLVGLGVALMVNAKLLVLPPEGFTQALTYTLTKRFGPNPRMEFGNLKILVDTTQVVLAAILSLIFFGGLVRVREGTIAAALAVGWVVKVVSRFLPATQAR